MGWLFEKYAAPFDYLDVVIQSRQFTRFVVEFLQQKNEDDLYELWLYKVLDGTSFEAFKKKLADKTRGQAIKNERLMKATVTESLNMLDSFKPV